VLKAKALDARFEKPGRARACRTQARTSRSGRHILPAPLDALRVVRLGHPTGACHSETEQEEFAQPGQGVLILKGP
jgi:hypothetical protein